MTDGADPGWAGRTAKFPVRQAFRPGNLRGKRAQRNVASKLCTAKQLFGPAARFIALDSGTRAAIRPRASIYPTTLVPRLFAHAADPPSVSFQADFHHDARRSFPYGQCDPGPGDGCGR